MNILDSQRFASAPRFGVSAQWRFWLHIRPRVSHETTGEMDAAVGFKVPAATDTVCMDESIFITIVTHICEVEFMAAAPPTK